MCLLIVLRGVDPEFPLVVAGNRDEERARGSAPPGLFVGDRQRILSPRDRVGGGTWMGVNSLGMFAGLTNLAVGAAAAEGGRAWTTRGILPHLALDVDATGLDGLEAGAEAVRKAVAGEAFQPFQIVLAHREGILVLVHREGQLDRTDVVGDRVVLSNEHRAGELKLPDELLRLDPVPAESASWLERGASLRRVLVDEGGISGHPILKRGGTYGTVSSSLIGIPAEDLLHLEWWFAAGEPDQKPYRNYGNLAKRL